MPLNYDSLTASTREIFLPKVIDNTYNYSAFLNTLLKDDKVLVKGGRKVVEPLRYGKSTSVGWYSKYDTFDTTPQDKVSASEYEWGKAYSNISISGDEETDNMGTEKVFSLLADKMEDADMALRDMLGTALYSGTDTKGIIGLATAIAQGTYGSINGATYTWWQSGVDSTAHTSANMRTSSSSSYILTLLQNAVRSATHKGQKPNLILMPLFIWDIYESVLQQNAQYNKMNARTEMLADGGFNVLNFRGIPVVGDEFCPDGKSYVLNTNFLKFRVNPARNFYFTGYKEATNSDVKAGQILLKAQLCVNNRRMHYAFTNLPTS